ncbi:MAG TPA: hypothetical protein VH063_13470 [Gaiellaceae bacterium]|jgi:hypothetical protein|nr:hypothetical protein [Gaiellaceae bacterium]
MTGSPLIRFADGGHDLAKLRSHLGMFVLGVFPVPFREVDAAIV